MKIAITSTGKDLESQVDPRFGRCQHFIVLDPDTMKFSSHDNQAGMQRGGAGPMAAKAISDLGATVVITGDVGPNAFDALKAAGIQAFIGASGTVAQAIQKWKNKQLKEIGSASVTEHSGMR
ncbi:MAG: NifB/NifX family molybdenum-iron cluster-binding protein [Thermoplasmata archaeon]|nr:NifB/NifX family molybdenum-iron cluster-binding protein [Thermoplasmata archaeon]